MSSQAGPPPTEAGTTLVVHDLKNLAGRLAALCQNLAQRYEDPLFKGTALDLLDDTVGHLRRLAEDLRGHDGRLMIKLRLNLNEILDKSLADNRPDLVRGTKIIKQYDDQLPLVWGDQLLLREAFNCAIENALEAIGDSGMLGVKTSVSRRGKKPKVVVEIADTGRGMSEEFMRERLFKPFTTTKNSGLGLGLYTIRQVMGLHGGSLRIVSAEGAGTRVRFHLPVD